ncbi:primosomal protein N' [Synechococcus sp. KORDI-49]|uniref:replication restart helicase PriA n=1 Tax=Synechococcus sp. KORDI-49 TaxID=585423 RepID=UPI0004E03549|nr:primosomal protein N' [Synechococcus sp. KORDI-49]AII47214.1 primosomal protein N' [Synechococcus sp. KORDI-49]
MKFSDPCNILSADGQPVDVWLEAGREGRVFTYRADPDLRLQPGDLVRVPLRNRTMHGLVVGCPVQAMPADRQAALQPVEALLQRAAVPSDWRQWLDGVAERCHLSAFRMLKAALPAGWLGQARASAVRSGRRLWWLQRTTAQPLPDLTQRQLDLLAYLDRQGGGSWQRGVEAAGFSGAVVAALVRKGCIEREQRQSSADAELSSPPHLESPRVLTEEQQKAVAAYQTLAPGKGLLLWGITGSGKTEVYLQLAAAELAAGRHVLLLTPEIGLIPQLVDRCRRRFGARVLEYHSGCRDRERLRAWQHCLEPDQPLVVVGTRSAMFMPLDPLGLVVLDEEHDSSYKQDSPMPCYHARDLAMDRVQRCGGRVVLGSATPSLDSWVQLSPDGPLTLACLRRRISEQPLPPVHVVDMRHELAEGHRRLISRPLMERLQQLPERGEQAVVLVPRRGYSPFLGCRSCGEVVQCPHCDVALTVHRGHGGRQWLRCHWCDHRAEIETRCNHCGSTAFKPFGAGTQRVLELLAEELEDLRLLRFDRDSTGGRDGHRRLLDRFAAGEADVLIGTQMLAKGMDLPRVTLAAVLAADGLLHRPDLRAGEQALQLLLQLAGRAGRGERPGQVLVQTYSPEHPVIRHLVDGRYEDFLAQEIQLRREAGLVPFSRACLLRLSGESATATATAATVLAERIRPLCSSQGWWLVGPAPAPVARVAGRSRWQLLMHGPAGSPLPLPSGEALWEGLPQGVALAVDPDPLDL